MAYRRVQTARQKKRLDNELAKVNRRKGFQAEM